MRTLSLAALLCLFWLVTSGHLDPLLLGSMAIASILVVLVSHRLGVVDDEGHPIQLLPRAIGFWTWLLGSVLRSNARILLLLLQRRPAIAPQVFEIPITQRSDLGRAIVANCVTITPGTLTLDVHDDRLIVHALTEAAAADLGCREVDRRVAAWMSAAADPGAAR